jgi:hypothetical protein
MHILSTRLPRPSRLLSTSAHAQRHERHHWRGRPNTGKAATTQWPRRLAVHLCQAIHSHARHIPTPLHPILRLARRRRRARPHAERSIRSILAQTIQRDAREYPIYTAYRGAGYQGQVEDRHDGGQGYGGAAKVETPRTGLAFQLREKIPIPRTHPGTAVPRRRQRLDPQDP